MNRTLLALSASAALCACATATRGAAEPAARGDWKMTAQEDSATLTFEAAGGARLRFECHGGQAPELGLMAWGPGPDLALERSSRENWVDTPFTKVALSAGSRRQSYETLAMEAEGGGLEAIGRAAKADPVIQAFRRRGALSMRLADGPTETLASSPGNSAVADFFNWCH